MRCRVRPILFSLVLVATALFPPTNPQAGAYSQVERTAYCYWPCPAYSTDVVYKTWDPNFYDFRSGDNYGCDWLQGYYSDGSNWYAGAAGWQYTCWPYGATLVTGLYTGTPLFTQAYTQNNYIWLVF